MLEAIRKRAGSLVVKILFLFLVLSFVVWGIADVFRPGGGADWAAEGRRREDLRLGLPGGVPADAAAG